METGINLWRRRRKKENAKQALTLELSMCLSAQVLSGLQERLSPNLYNHLTADDDTGYYYSLQVRVWW